MKRRKVIAWVSVLVVLVGLVVVLAFTAFSLKTVEVDYRTSSFNIEITDKQIIKASKIKKGGTIFFRNKKQYIKNIEQADPYINVINIETVFPNKMVIHIAERQEVYSVEHEGGFYICDEDLKVLRVSASIDGEKSLPLSVGAPVGSYKVGDFITEIKNPKLYQAFFENNRNLGAQQELIKSIEVGTKYDTEIKDDVNILKIDLHSGQTLTIANYHFALSYKVHLFLEAYSNLFDMIGKESLQEDGSKVVLTQQNLETCEIYVDNEYSEGLNGYKNEENCYFKIFRLNKI